ncbi:ribosomal L1 domain-containing protein CG13096-like [Zerene cesonia]|uniref:ribosomal L1 domain-containing protein CG13096-like n=1 Tax=Zerene cesonia TaxID=33412 RepID=UPI0018E53520|nr:ribosomal L1 domain-containing protein CG13096-like [Zerene cesonia]
MVAIKNLSKSPKKEKIKDTPKKVKNLSKTVINLPQEKSEQQINSKKTVLKKKKVKYVYPSKAVTGIIVDSCLNALQKLTEHHNTKNVIFGDESPIFLQIRCIKIQNDKGNIKFTLPYSTVASSGEVCLITPDLKKGKKVDHEPTIEHWEEILRKAGVTSVKTILPMRQLRVEYDQFELRRRLMTQHDYIMVDTRVLNHVSHLLGTMFFKKHNMLIPVKLNENKDIKKSIDIGLRTAMLRLSEGPISTIVVGHTAMPAEQIRENVLAIIKQFSEKYPGGEANIRSLCIKLPLSLSLPLYMTLRSSNLISAPKIKKSQPKEYQFYEDELSTIPGSRVKVGPDGTVYLKKNLEGDAEEKDSAEEMEDDEEDEKLEDLSENDDE